MPTRSPVDAVVEPGEQRRRGRGDRRGVARVVAADHFEQQRRVVDRRRERADLVERRRERDRARSARPRRRWASRRRRRTAPRAGGSSRRCRSRARAARTRPRPPPPNRRSNRRAPASRSCGLRVGPNAEFSVEEPIANSSRLVLPTTTAPASRSALARPSRRTAAASPRGCATSTSWGRRACRGCPSARSARRRAARDRHRARPRRRPRRPRPRASSASTRLNACTSASRARDLREVLLEHVARRAPPGAHVGRDRDRESHAHGSSPRMRGTRKRSSSAWGAAASTSSAVRPGAPRRPGTRSRAAAGARSAARRAVSSADTCAAWSRIAPSSVGERHRSRRR